jgi:hypothetical protein
LSGFTALRSGRIVRTVLGAVFVATALGLIAVPPFRAVVVSAVSPAAVEVRRMAFPEFRQVQPKADPVGLGDGPDHAVVAAFDGGAYTYWLSDEANPSLSAEFAQPIDLGLIYLYAGPPEGDVQAARPARIRIDYREGGSDTIEVRDNAGGQPLRVGPRRTSALSVTITAVHGPAGTPIAVTELAFYERR